MSFQSVIAECLFDHLAGLGYQTMWLTPRQFYIYSETEFKVWVDEESVLVRWVNGRGTRASDLLCSMSTELNDPALIEKVEQAAFDFVTNRSGPLKPRSNNADIVGRKSSGRG